MRHGNPWTALKSSIGAIAALWSLQQAGFGGAVVREMGAKAPAPKRPKGEGRPKTRWGGGEPRTGMKYHNSSAYVGFWRR